MKQSKKITIDWINFDSLLESKYYEENKSQIKRCHPRFILQNSFKKYWKKIRLVYYEADFELKDWTIIDVKWYPTETAKLKKKLFDFAYPDTTLLRVVKYKWEWIDYDDNQKRKKKNK
jgi:hypothetical protein